MATKADEEAQQTLKCQTWTLKVSIHCEGCKKRVKKVLQSIEGVYHTEVDSQQHKVTVTGNVDAETLIKKLLGTGKLAELWPEKKENKSGKSKNAKDQKNMEEAAGSTELDQNKNSSHDNNPSINGNDLDGGESDKEGKESKEADEEEGGGGAGAGADAKKKKKKKKKSAQTGNSANGGGENIGAGDLPLPSKSSMEPPAPLLSPVHLIPCPPFQHAYPYPQMHYPPPPGPQPYGLSYNTVYPSSSASYYAPFMHAYTYFGHPPPPPPSDLVNNTFNEDDEAGRCSVM